MEPYDNQPGYLIDQTSSAVRNNSFAKFMEGYGRYGIKTVRILSASAESKMKLHLSKFDEGWSSDMPCVLQC